MGTEIQKPDLLGWESVVRAGRVAEVAASLLVPQVGVYSGLASSWFRYESLEARLTESVRFAAGLVPFFGNFLDLADAVGGTFWRRSVTGKEMGRGTAAIAGAAGLFGLAMDLRGVGFFFRMGGMGTLRSSLYVTAYLALRGLFQREAQAVTRELAERTVREAIEKRFRGRELPPWLLERSVLRTVRVLRAKDPSAAVAAAIRSHSIKLSALESGPFFSLGPVGYALRPGAFSNGFWRSVGAQWLRTLGWRGIIGQRASADRLRGKAARREESVQDLLHVGWWARRIGYYQVPRGEPVRRVVSYEESPLPELRAAGNIVRIEDKRWRTVFYHRLDPPTAPVKGVIVMVHGAGAMYSQGGCFISAINRLAKEGWHVVAFDLPYHGLGVRDDSLKDLDRLLSYVHGIFVDTSLRYRCPVVVLGRSFGANLMLEYGSRNPHFLAGIIPMSGYSRESLDYSLTQFERDAAAGLFEPNRPGFEWATTVERQFTWWDRGPFRRLSLAEASPRQLRYFAPQTPYLYMAGKLDPEYPPGAWNYWRTRADRDGSETFLPDQGRHDLLDGRNAAVFEPTIAKIDSFATNAVREKILGDQLAREMALRRYRRI